MGLNPIPEELFLFFYIKNKKKTTEANEVRPPPTPHPHVIARGAAWMIRESVLRAVRKSACEFLADVKPV